jgi:hypothetical protein
MLELLFFGTQCLSSCPTGFFVGNESALRGTYVFLGLLLSCPASLTLLPNVSGPPHTSVTVDTNQPLAQRNVLEEWLSVGNNPT